MDMVGANLHCPVVYKVGASKSLTLSSECPCNHGELRQQFMDVCGCVSVHGAPAAPSLIFRVQSLGRYTCMASKSIFRR